MTAVRQDSEKARDALNELCRVYWRPIYVYLRRCGHPQPESEDLTQGFLFDLMRRDGFQAVDASKGKFRSFLLASLKNFVANHHDRLKALKRGAGIPVISLDDPGVEALYRLEPVDEMTPERVFERRWALTLLEQTRERLRGICSTGGKADRFEELIGFLPGETRTSTQAEAAVRLGLTEGAVKIEVHRLKRRYRELLRMEVARTLTDGEDVDDELRYLMRAVAGTV